MEEIKILYEEYTPSKDNPRLLVPIGGKMVGSQFAKGFNKKSDGMEASGYVVWLNEYIVRPAKKMKSPLDKFRFIEKYTIITI